MIPKPYLHTNFVWRIKKLGQLDGVKSFQLEVIISPIHRLKRFYVLQIKLNLFQYRNRTVDKIQLKIKCVRLICVRSLSSLHLVIVHLKKLTEQIFFYQRCVYSNALSPKNQIWNIFLFLQKIVENIKNMQI